MRSKGLRRPSVYLNTSTGMSLRFRTPDGCVRTVFDHFLTAKTILPKGVSEIHVDGKSRLSKSYVREFAELHCESAYFTASSQGHLSCEGHAHFDFLFHLGACDLRKQDAPRRGILFAKVTCIFISCFISVHVTFATRMPLRGASFLRRSRAL